MPPLIRVLEHEANALERVTRAWRDPNTHQLYGLGPDAQKKWRAIIELAATYGYAPESDPNGGVMFEFDPTLAEKRDIPRACWPESMAEVEG